MKLIFTCIMLVVFKLTLSAQDLRTKLETAYLLFGDAVKTKDIGKLKNSMSTYSYITIKNESISEQLKFPDNFFSSAPRMISDLKKQTFVRAAENGSTANSIYYGKDAFGSESIIIIHFLKENNLWKFNSVQNKISSEIMTKIKAKDTSFYKEKGFSPDGIVPATPKEIMSCDYKAMLDVMAPGYNVSIKINGIVQPGPDGNGFNTDKGNTNVLVLGGVNKGVNKIEITVEPIKGKQQKTLMVNLAKMIGGDELEVFSMEQDKPAPIISKEFTVK